MDDRMQRISFDVTRYATTSALWASVAALLKVLHETDYIAVVSADLHDRAGNIVGSHTVSSLKEINDLAAPLRCKFIEIVD